uniref:RING-type domain-containing protein n=1 Tax=Aplanochytrium stocchinoi TaxID=215587 RepID=A0A7S3V0C3_9STRA|mmetsp:Transcript_29343/g.36274  ORF Transcript_29343/g.36274 Transcript_29343/m.36274 type:complete len:636 (+) Transcript_29343:347-2254(+)|eukprot:CAMPEP_0204827462 /NCGR_PEP_ID=MMETSP1346-20131115/4912_1 /ASSEMBLY_ACC=CAM_ASM_000771 /TAXON_ID=215587 /ORGANISM="Aplanochytrium stocchinoi, Strain GSBS06" /LENGTH=635 /DNA_ID=CAMNT_0051955899 /DNA_START=360 /DNA_END=2267 /DNA_ORIENTATION=+
MVLLLGESDISSLSVGAAGPSVGTGTITSTASANAFLSVPLQSQRLTRTRSQSMDSILRRSTGRALSSNNREGSLHSLQSGTTSTRPGMSISKNTSTNWAYRFPDHDKELKTVSHTQSSNGATNMETVENEISSSFNSDGVNTDNINLPEPEAEEDVELALPPPPLPQIRFEDLILQDQEQQQLQLRFRPVSLLSGRKSVPKSKETKALASPSYSHKKGKANKEGTDDICFICMGSFTRKNPPITTPCMNVCNNTPLHAKCIFEWSERQKSSPSCPLCRGPLGKVSYTPPDLLRSNLFFMFGFRKAFITLPVPRNVGIVRCYLKAERSTIRGRVGNGQIVWKMYLQAPPKLRYPLGPKPGVESPVEGDQLLLIARKRKFTHSRRLGSIIDMTLDAKGKDFNRRGVNYVGSVRSSVLGLEHAVVAPVHEATIPRRGNRVSCVGLGHVKYTQNRVGRAVGPRRMQLSLPTVSRTGTQNSNNELLYHDVVSSNVNLEEDEDSDADNSEDDNTENSSLPKWTTKAWRPTKSKRLKKLLRSGNHQNVEDKSVIFASNREPYWLEQINAYSLDFQGRVTLPSNKNFQLVSEERPNDVVLQFGKVVETGKVEIYTLDLQWPFSPLQAFGICLSACDRKLACA